MEIIDEINKVVTRARNKNTQKNLRQGAKILMVVLPLIGVKKITDFTDEICDDYIDEMCKLSKAGKLGGTFKTVQKKVSLARNVLNKCGLASPLHAKLFEDDKHICVASGIRRTTQQVQMTPDQAGAMFEMGRAWVRGDAKPPMIQGRQPSQAKLTQGYVYLMTTMPYAIRHHSAMGLTWGDVNESTFTYIVTKAKEFPTETVRTMNPLTWDAICMLAKTVENHDPDAKLLFNESWLYAYIATLAEMAGVKRVNGRYGVHMARRSFATFCYTNGEDMTGASAGLDHSSTATTERIYVGMGAKQQKGDQMLQKFQSNYLDLDSSIDQLKADMAEFAQMVRESLVSERVAFVDQSEESKAFLSKHGIDEKAAIFNVSISDNSGSPFQIRTGVL